MIHHIQAKQQFPQFKNKSNIYLLILIHLVLNWKKILTISSQYFLGKESYLKFLAVFTHNSISFLVLYNLINLFLNTLTLLEIFTSYSVSLVWELIKKKLNSKTLSFNLRIGSKKMFFLKVPYSLRTSLKWSTTFVSYFTISLSLTTKEFKDFYFWLPQKLLKDWLFLLNKIKRNICTSLRFK